MICAREFLGKDSTIIRDTYTVETNGILKSLRIRGKRRKKHKKTEKEKRRKRRKSKKKKRHLLPKCRWWLKFFII
uniref:Uncharacterized protein n=1 Tax=Colobus angolensis palliatus TaxID=336983 RepID=A0A2K5JP74_COLAP